MSTIKDYQTLILVVPAIAGGIYQIYMILSILGFSYLRYFSVAQVIPDGLIALFFFTYLFVFYKIISIVFTAFTPSTSSHSGWKVKIYLVLIAIFFICSLIYLAKSNLESATNILDFFGHLSLLVSSYICLVLSILLVIDVLHDYEPDVVNSSVFQISKNVIFFIFFILIFRSFPSAFENLSYEINRNSTFYNFEKLAQKVQKEYDLSGVPQHVYSNRDYVFYKINYNNETNFIAVDTKELTAFESDDKKD